MLRALQDPSDAGEGRPRLRVILTAMRQEEIEGDGDLLVVVLAGCGPLALPFAALATAAALCLLFQRLLLCFGKRVPLRLQILDETGAVAFAHFLELRHHFFPRRLLLVLRLALQ